MVTTITRLADRRREGEAYPLPTPDEIRAAQAATGLADRELAQLLGIRADHLRRLKLRDPKTDQRRTMSETTARLFWALALDGYRPPDWPRD